MLMKRELHVFDEMFSNPQVFVLRKKCEQYLRQTLHYKVSGQHVVYEV
jgi:hypothetical protein